jgi:hypothetical protein
MDIVFLWLVGLTALVGVSAIILFAMLNDIKQKQEDNFKETKKILENKPDIFGRYA